MNVVFILEEYSELQLLGRIVFTCLGCFVFFFSVFFNLFPRMAMQFAILCYLQQSFFSSPHPFYQLVLSPFLMYPFQ